MLQFPDEEKRCKQLQLALGSQFDLAEHAYSYWLTRPENSYLLNSSETPWPRTVNVPRKTIHLAMTMNVQMLRLFRSAVEMCSRGESLSANILTRSLYETVLALDFILRNEVAVFIGPVMHKECGSKMGKQKELDGLPMFQVKPLSTKSSDTRVILSRDQRTKFYIAHDFLGRKRHTRSLASIPEMKAISDEQIAQEVPGLDELVRSNVGDKWYTILKESKSWSGLSIRDLTTVLGSVFETWHAIVYPVQSRMSHSGDALQLIGGFLDNDDIYWKMFSTNEEVSGVLLVATALFIGGLRVVQDCIDLGEEHEKVIEELHAENKRLRDESNKTT